jgi:FixJ family two-component response regulator
MSEAVMDCPEACPVSSPEMVLFVVNDDGSFREGLRRLLTSAGCTVEAVPGAAKFLVVKRGDVRSCSVLDAELSRRYSLLTPRERQVMARIVVGRLNKQIAAEFGTSKSTVNHQRACVMKKMQAPSLAQLVRIAARLEIRAALTCGEVADSHELPAPVALMASACNVDQIGH